MRKVLSVLVVLTMSCASLLPRPDTPGTAASRQECEAISASFGVWGVIGAVGGGTALASGVTNAILTDDTTEIVLGLTSLGGGVVAAASAIVSTNAARQYVDRCTINTGGQPEETSPAPTAPPQ